MPERKKPHILFILEKWCDLNPECGESNNEHNLIGSLESSGLATYDRFYYDQFWYKHNFSCGAALVKQCLDFKPDLIVLSGFPDNPNIGPSIKEIWNPIIRQKMGIPIVAFCYDTVASPIAGDSSLSNADLNVVLDSSSYLAKSSQPDKYLHLWTPQDGKIYHNFLLERDIDVSFIGTVLIEGREHLYSDRRKGIDALRKAGIEVYQAGGQRSEQRLSVEEYARLFMRSKISLNFPRTEMNLLQCKGRVFEAILCGSLLIEEENPETAKWFEPNVDYVTYTDKTNLVKKVKYYLEHDDERVEIATRGYEKAKSKYTGFTFWLALFERLGLKVEDSLAFQNRSLESQTSQTPENQPKEANSSSGQLEASLRWNSISELFSQILHQTDLLNIKGYHTPKNNCIALESLLRKVAKKQMKVLEIGSWKGMATAVMGGVLSEYQGTIFSIDTWKGSSSIPSMKSEAGSIDIFNVFIQNMKILGLFHKVVKPIPIESVAAAQIFQSNSLDFIFIDGDLSYSSVKQDILAWLPKLKEGGTICGHCGDGYYSHYSETVKAEIYRKREVDYIQEIRVHPGVVMAAYEVFRDKHEIMPGTSLWFYQKKAIDSQWLVGSSHLRCKGKAEEVISTYRNAINQNPNFSWYHQKLGSTLLKRGNLEEAIVAYNSALKIKPNSATLHLNLGDALVKKGSLDEAIAHYQTAFELKPDSPLPQKKLAKLEELERSLKHITCYASSTTEEIYEPQNLFWGERMIWHCQSPPQYPEWLEFELPQPQKWGGISIKPQQGHYERAPSTFTIMGSNDKQQWNSLLSVSNYKWISENWQKWNFDNQNEYKYYKIEISANSNDSNWLTVERLAPIIDNLSVKPI